MTERNVNVFLGKRNRELFVSLDLMILSRIGPVPLSLNLKPASPNEYRFADGPSEKISILEATVAIFECPKQLAMT